MTHPSTSRHGHPQKTSSALIRFDPQRCSTVQSAWSLIMIHETHRRLTSRHILDMFGSHANLSDSHPSSSFLLPFHLSIWAIGRFSTGAGHCFMMIFMGISGPSLAHAQIISNNPPELLRKIQVSNPTHGLLRPFTKQRSNGRKQDQLRNHFRSGPASMLCHGELYCVMGSCIVGTPGAPVFALQT